MPVCSETDCQMSKTFIGGAVCREFESEAPAAEENVRLSRMQQRTLLFSDCALKVQGGDDSATFLRSTLEVVGYRAEMLIILGLQFFREKGTQIQFYKSGLPSNMWQRLVTIGLESRESRPARFGGAKRKEIKISTPA